MEPAPRKISLRHPVLAGWLLLLFLAQIGCGHGPLSRSGSGSERVESVGVVSARFLPDVVLDLPAKGRVEGAVRGAGKGFLDWAEFPLRLGAEGLRGCNGKECGYVAIGFLALATATGTVGAVVGGVQGAIRAIPAGEARRIEEATRYLADLNIQEGMRDLVLDAALEGTDCRIRSLPDAGPPASDCVVDYRGFAGRGIDSVVEVSVLSIGFKGETWGRRPPLSVVLKVRVRRVRTMDGQMLEEKVLEYRSEERQFPDWMANEAVLMEEEFEKGYGKIAGEIAGGTGCASAGEPGAE